MVVLGVAAGIGVYRYVDESAATDDGYQVYALFDDAEGLIAKSRVVIAGIPVGEIDTIGLEGNRARVDINISGDVDLHPDATISMRQVSLLGQKVLVIDPGVAGERVPDGSRIAVASEAPSTNDILATVGDIAESVRSVAQQLERSFGTDEAGDRMESALRNLSEALEGVNRTIQANEENVNRTLASLEHTTRMGGPPLVHAIENVEAATDQIRTLLAEQRPDIERTVSEADDTVSSIRRASERLEDVLADVRVATDRVARGEGTLGRLSADETLIDEVEGAVEGVSDLVGGIGRLRTILELRNEYNLLANTFKSYFSVRLQPREGRYFLVQLVDDPRGSVDVTQTTVRRSPALPTEPGEYQETRIVSSRGLRFSLQFAKRIRFATFRFGILESTGALGLDLNFFDDRFEVNTDFFAIGVQQFPRVRARIGFEFVRRLWVVGGVDDVLNNNTDFFLGLQLRFVDDDLKSLLPFVGGLVPSG